MRFVCVLSFLFLGCARTVALGATPLYPAATSDAPDVWVYIDTGERSTNGIYRCRQGQPPVCTRARLAQ